MVSGPFAFAVLVSVSIALLGLVASRRFADRGVRSVVLLLTSLSCVILWAMVWFLRNVGTD